MLLNKGLEKVTLLKLTGEGRYAAETTVWRLEWEGREKAEGETPLGHNLYFYRDLREDSRSTAL